MAAIEQFNGQDFEGRNLVVNEARVKKAADAAEIAAIIRADSFRGKRE